MPMFKAASEMQFPSTREYYRGKYHCTVDLLFDWFELVCLANKNKTCQLSYKLFQTSQTGGQLYSDTSPFSIPCLQCHYHLASTVIGLWSCSVFHRPWYSLVSPTFFIARSAFKEPRPSGHDPQHLRALLQIEHSRSQVIC